MTSLGVTVPGITSLQTVSVLLEHRLEALNRAVGLLRRLRLAVHSISMSPSAAGSGLARLTITLSIDQTIAERIVKLFQKSVGVKDAVAFSVNDGISRELVLIKIRPPREREGELLDVLHLFHATIVEESSDALVAEVTGPEAFILSCIRAIDRFEILDIARSGAVSLERGPDTGEPSRSGEESLS